MNKRRQSSDSKEKNDVDVWKKLQHPPLSHFLHVREGIKTGDSDLFIIQKEEKNQVEDESLRSLVQAEDIDPFQYEWNEQWIIYTNQSHFNTRFPKAIDYLKKYKLTLKRRSAVWMFDKKWWELEEPLEEQVFQETKIISPLISNKNSFTLDTKGYFCLDDCILAYPRSVTEIKELMQDRSTAPKKVEHKLDELVLTQEELLHYILGIMNSMVIEYFLKNKIERKSFRKKGNVKYYWYKPKYIESIPIPLPTGNEQKEVFFLVKDLLKLGEDLSSSNQNKREKRKKFNRLRTELNELIFDIFNLDEKERAKVQVFLSRI